MSAKLIFILLLTLPVMISVTAPPQTNQAGPITLLDVPLIHQKTKVWCWAACTEMILRFMGQDDGVEQCEQANERFGRTDCCEPPALVRPGPREDCVQTQWPQFFRYDFESDSIDAALTWEQLRAQLDNHQPVAFTWAYLWDGERDGTGHIQVATGYGYSESGESVVYVNNPFPTAGSSEQRRADYYFIPYDEYVSNADTHEHWRDYFNIRPKVDPELQRMTSRSSESSFARSSAATSSPRTPGSAVGPSGSSGLDQNPSPIGGYKKIQRNLRYPAEMQAIEDKARVVINALISSQGQVSETNIFETTGHELLDQAAIDAIKSTRWQPAIRQGKAVEAWVSIPITFKLQ